jgi:hypothetical protein
VRIVAVHVFLKWGRGIGETKSGFRRGAVGTELSFSRTFARFEVLSSLRMAAVPENRIGPFRYFSVPVPDRKTVSPYRETVSVRIFRPIEGADLHPPHARRGARS